MNPQYEVLRRSIPALNFLVIDNQWKNKFYNTAL